MEHLPLLLGLLVLGLIIFGPKKMIEMAGSMGKMLRELQAAVKEMNWNVLGEDKTPSATPTTLSKLSQLAQDLTASPTSTTAAPPSPAAVAESPATVVEPSAAESPAPTEQPPAVPSDAQGEL